MELFNILPKIREVDAAVHPADQQWLRESHPEVTFRLLGGAAESKKTAAGQAQRLTRLASRLPPFEPAAVRARLGPARVQIDDVLDAAACLVAARRMLDGVAVTLPHDTVELDARGLRMEIVS